MPWRGWCATYENGGSCERCSHCRNALLPPSPPASCNTLAQVGRRVRGRRQRRGGVVGAARAAHRLAAARAVTHRKHSYGCARPVVTAGRRFRDSSFTRRRCERRTGCRPVCACSTASSNKTPRRVGCRCNGGVCDGHQRCSAGRGRVRHSVLGVGRQGKPRTRHCSQTSRQETAQSLGPVIKLLGFTTSCNYQSEQHVLHHDIVISVCRFEITETAMMTA